MKCYYHPEKDAVGICKNCNNGICKECASDVGNGLACKCSCEDEVRTINQITALSKTAFKKTGVAYKRMTAVFLFLGVFFITFGIIDEQLRLFMIIVGVIMLLGAALCFLSGKSIEKQNSAASNV